MPARNHGSCIHQNKYPVQDDEYNYHDSLQACFIEGIAHYTMLTISMIANLQGLLLEVTQLDKSSQLSSVVVSLSDMMHWMTSENKYNKEF